MIYCEEQNKNICRFISGYASFVSDVGGSVFVPKLCKVLDTQGTTCDLSHIIASVNKSVSEKIFSYHKRNVAQCPEAMSTLCKRFTFGNIGKGQGEGFIFFNFALLKVVKNEMSVGCKN